MGICDARREFSAAVLSSVGARKNLCLDFNCRGIKAVGVCLYFVEVVQDILTAFLYGCAILKSHYTV